MTTYVDEGIVLRRVDYGETDRVLTVLTRAHGKVGVIARGVRKAGSRLAPHTDLFVRSTMQLAQGRGQLEVLAQAQRSGPLPPAGDARRAACAALCAELADAVLEPDHPLEEGIFELLAEAITSCADPHRDPRAAMAWFARRMIDRLGYAPELRRCANCGDELTERPALFSAAGGGLLCPACAIADPGGVECSTTVIKVLRVIATGDAALYARLRLDDTDLTTLEAVVERELAQHVDRRLRSLAVLRAVFSPGPG
jgi:DNA repair protein RecO (recombination protein O)